MAYNSVTDRKAFNGAPSPWAKNFSTMVAHCWVNQNAKYLFADWIIETGGELVALPKVDGWEVEALAFYRPRLGGNKFSYVLRVGSAGHFDELISNWSAFGAAFVHFRINPTTPSPLDVLDHNGSVRIVNELGAMDRPPLPSLKEFDDAIGSSLVEGRKLSEDEGAYILGLSGVSEGAVI